jgi:exodeoxyribonuclease VII small subunit
MDRDCMSDQTLTPADIEKMSFEDALSALEAIVRQLESGQVKLDEAVRAYETGVALQRKCEARLADARAKVEKLVQTPDGGLAKAEFDTATSS